MGITPITVSGLEQIDTRTEDASISDENNVKVC
jgi:hypothetical protein